MTDHPNATDYRNRSERAEQEATEAWACADRLAEALEPCVNVLTDPVVGTIYQDEPKWYEALGRAVEQARQALAAYREKRG